MQRFAGLAPEQGELAAADDVAGIELPNDVHDGDARFVVARFDGGLDTGGSTVARQQRGVGVDDGQAGDVDDALGENLPVGHDDDEVGLEAAQFLHGGGVAHFLGLEHRNACLLRADLDARRGQGLVPPDGAVGLGDERHQLPRAFQGVEGGNGDIPRSHHDNAHGEVLAVSAIPVKHIPPPPRTLKMISLHALPLLRKNRGKTCERLDFRARSARLLRV